MPVTTKHPDYKKHLPEWVMMRDALEGEAEIKAKGTIYLPKTDGQQSLEDAQGQAASHLYESYKQRAKYPRWVSDALRSMMGLVSRLEPQFEPPASMRYLEKEATSDGFGVRELFIRIVRELLITGRVAIAASVDQRGQAYAALYPAESVINWKESQVGGRRDLSLAVLTEAQDASEDEYDHDFETMYRVLDLDNGTYRKRLLDSNGSVVEEVTPRSRGVGIRYLPVIFAGSTDNNPDVDEVPLLTMAQSAVKSYQLSADYFEALHKTAHPQAWVATAGEVNFEMTGPGTIWKGDEGAQFGYLEISGNGIAATHTAMADERNAALEAGARVIDVGGQTESGDARRARQDDQHASLHSIVRMAEQAVNQFIEYAMDLTNATGEYVFSVEPDFSVAEVDAQMTQQLLNAAMAGGISFSSFWAYVTTGKVPERDYEDEVQLIETAGVPTRGA